ncbi:lantibiotic dehydratase [Dyadobacter sp. CY261]|uniref:lantibiotic dehydratase n=1 Tax=Dyadobacter sp. CY261 TaxID=2907203 RepID=UPI001F26EE56|nr:lantibiotic dehydratase [Dyadobacter sp. CY261]MCF0075646.1 lantibiotic dehydratase [Dyadobacter sp. CY261]
MYNEPYDFFMLRRAAMPTCALASLHQQCGDDFQKWEVALLEFYQTEPFRQAIYLASPSLSAAMNAYDKQAPEKFRRKVLFSLYKYLIRMSTRATPFGLFSVTGTGLLAERSKLSGLAINKVKKTIRLQMTALVYIASFLEKQQMSTRQTRYVANSSLYPTPTGYRYIETKTNGQTLEHVISEVERFDELALLLEAAGTPQTKIELADRLREKFSPDQSIQLIQDMIDLGLLLNEVSPNATGPDFEDRLKEDLDRYRAKSREAQKLHKLICELHGRDSASCLQNTARELTNIIPALSGQQLFRAQLSLLASGITLSKKVVAKLADDFAAVKGLLRSNQQSSPLTVLKQKFRAHYGDRLLPLSELLESEMGMEYAGLAVQAGKPPTLLAHLEFTHSEYTSSGLQTAASRIKQQVLDRALSRQLYEVEILESDLKTLAGQPAEQAGFYWLGEMLSSSAKNIDGGYLRFYLKAAGGQSGLELMARFAQDDPLLASRLSDAARELAEIDKDNIHAEIAHIPDAKTAAVLSRPHLWPYEIPYLSYSVMPKSRQITVSDILVSISEDDCFILTSKSLIKRIIPHNTTAHNYGLGLPVYQFLSDVANQQSQLMAWNWERLESFSFLPRVLFRQLILSPARWNLSGENRQMILDMIELDEHWQQLQDHLRIPRLIQICEGDNLLLIDFNSRFSRMLFKAELQKSDRLQIQEYLQSNTYQPVTDKRELFAHELVVAFKPSATQAPVRPPVPRNEQRMFHLGSEWLYLKIFLSVVKADQLLTTTLAGICQQLTDEGYVSKWFYVRYFDPSYHLRIRLRLATKQRWHLVLARLRTALENTACQGAIEKIQTDTYERELERYHSLSFEMVESIFYKDSLASVKVISLLGHECDDQGRWLAALYAVDAMLNDFGLSINERADFAKTSYQRFLSEFAQNQALTRQLDSKYRKHRVQIQQTLALRALLPMTLESCFKERSAQIQSMRIEAISTAEISSYVHMCLNRILESNHRKQEMILFHFLSKYYKSATKLLHKFTN